MKRHLAMAASFLLVSACAAVTEEDMAASGFIASVDDTADTITLSTGETFVVPPEYELTGLTTGERVLVRYREQDGRMVATSIVQPGEEQG